MRNISSIPNKVLGAVLQMAGRIETCLQSAWVDI